MPWLGKQKQEITDQFLNQLWLDFSLLCLVAIPLSLSRAFLTGWLTLYTVHLLLGGVVAIVAVRRRYISVLTKGWVAIAILFVVGIMGMANFGLTGSGPFWLLSACVVASFIFRKPTVLLIIGLVFGIFALMGYCFHQGILVSKIDLNLYTQSSTSWLTFLLTNSLLALVIARAIKARYLLIFASAQHHYRQWLDDLPLALEVVDATHCSHYRNRAAEQLFGNNCPANTPLQLMARLLNLPSEEPLLRDALPAMQALRGHSVTYNAVRLQTPHAERVVRCWGWPGYHEDGHVEFGITVFEDITAQVELDRLKNEFVANVSHELRTPLTAIRGVVGLMLGGALGDLPKPAEQMARVCQQNTDRLLFLVNDLLDMQKIEQGKLEINAQPCAATQLLHDIEQNMQAYAQSFQVCIVLNDQAPHAVINVDPQRFQQILANLLSNAVKFSKKGSSVMLRSSVQGHQLILEVQDTGCGMSEAFKSRIFIPFSQADSADNRRRTGTGLGLSISKKLVEQMGGQINFSSEVDVGTTFELRFDLLEST